LEYRNTNGFNPGFVSATNPAYFITRTLNNVGIYNFPLRNESHPKKILQHDLGQGFYSYDIKVQYNEIMSSVSNVKNVKVIKTPTFNFNKNKYYTGIDNNATISLVFEPELAEYTNLIIETDFGYGGEFNKTINNNYNIPIGTLVRGDYKVRIKMLKRVGGVILKETLFSPWKVIVLREKFVITVTKGEEKTEEGWPPDYKYRYSPSITFNSYHDNLKFDIAMEVVLDVWPDPVVSRSESDSGGVELCGTTIQYGVYPSTGNWDNSRAVYFRVKIYNATTNNLIHDTNWISAGQTYTHDLD
jgi:hypothetical protein